MTCPFPECSRSRNPGFFACDAHLFRMPKAERAEAAALVLKAKSNGMSEEQFCIEAVEIMSRCVAALFLDHPSDPLINNRKWQPGRVSS